MASLGGHQKLSSIAFSVLKPVHNEAINMAGSVFQGDYCKLLFVDLQTYSIITYRYAQICTHRYVHTTYCSILLNYPRIGSLRRVNIRNF